VSVLRKNHHGTSAAASGLNLGASFSVCVRADKFAVRPRRERLPDATRQRIHPGSMRVLRRPGWCARSWIIHNWIEFVAKRTDDLLIEALKPAACMLEDKPGRRADEAPNSAAPAVKEIVLPLSARPRPDYRAKIIRGRQQRPQQLTLF
jgi:hypothetical protein